MGTAAPGDELVWLMSRRQLGTYLLSFRRLDLFTRWQYVPRAAREGKPHHKIFQVSACDTFAATSLAKPRVSERAIPRGLTLQKYMNKFRVLAATIYCGCTPKY